MKNLRSTLFISFDCGNQGHARPHTEENRLASPKSGESFAADRCMQQIELGLLKKEATDFFKTEVFCQALHIRQAVGSINSLLLRSAEFSGRDGAEESTKERLHKRKCGRSVDKGV